MWNAIDIAKRLIAVGYDPENPDESVLICPLRLQKLLYYCQGWSLGLLGRPLFHQPIEAWTYGPVVRDVYHQFKNLKDGISSADVGGPATVIPTIDTELIEMVWREYAHYTPTQLIHMTHHEPAWREARGELPPDAQSSTPLSLQTMADYFRQLARHKQHTWHGSPVIDPIAAWQEEAELESTGRGFSADEVFGELLAEAGEQPIA